MGFENIRSVDVEPTLQSGPETADANVREAVENV
jgi:hypothetical protein